MARKATFCQSNVPLGNSAAGHVFSWSVTTAAMNFTPFHGCGLRLTFWALIRAENCTTYSRIFSTGSAMVAVV